MLGDPPIVLDATLTPDFLAELTRCASADGVEIAAVEAPCPRGRGRTPRLATADRDERRAAVMAATATLELAAEVGADKVILKLGALDAPGEWAELVRAHARGQSIADAVEHAQRRRATRSPQAFDWARFALDPLIKLAAGRGLILALVNRARWPEIPDSAELELLLSELRGAPLAPWFDAAAAHAREVLGFGAATEWLATFGKSASGAWLTDACGLLGGLPWGQGETATSSTVTALGSGVLPVVHCASGACI